MGLGLSDDLISNQGFMGQPSGVNSESFSNSKLYECLDNQLQSNSTIDGKFRDEFGPCMVHFYSGSYYSNPSVYRRLKTKEQELKNAELIAND